MRLLTLSAAVLMPAALLAQAPAAPAYTAIYATESKSVPKDLAAFKEQEVLSRLAKVLSTPRPAFAKVRKVRIDERRGVIHLAEKLTRNQVYAAPEDFAFVRDFILARCPRAAVSGHTGGRDT